jgi:hypothetical protein
MQHIDKEVVQSLLANEISPAVTVYIPMLTTASPPHITENQIRFKNLLHKAAEELEARGESGISLAKELIETHDSLHEDMNFWENQTPGLLICAVAGNIQMFHLPIDTEEYVSVDDSFHLAPVIALLDDQREYYVLSLAQHDPALYKGDMYGISPTAIELPANAGVALGIDEPNQKSENQGSARGSSMNTGWFNGRGGARNPQDQDRVRFFRIINKVICEKLQASDPLIIAGVESDAAEFRALSTHPAILQGTIAGNQKDSSMDELYASAQEIVRQELVQPEHQSAIEEYNRLQGANPERVAQDNQSILEAAEQGRIDKLLARFSRHTTDTVQDGMQSVQRITFPDSETSKLINTLAAKVYGMSGKVIGLLPSEMPGGALMVARLRY